MNRLSPIPIFPCALKEKPQCLVCLDTKKRILFCVRDRFFVHFTKEGVGHYFHKTCLVEWLNTSLSQGKCPLCQATLNVKQCLRNSLLERGAQQLEIAAKGTLRGAYWGIWTWSAAQCFSSCTSHLGALKQIIGQTSSIGIYSLALQGLKALIGKRAMICLSLGLYASSLPKDLREIDVCEIEQELIATIALIFTLLSPEGIHILNLFREEGATALEDLSFYRRSWSAISSLLTGSVFYRALYSPGRR